MKLKMLLLSSLAVATTSLAAPVFASPDKPVIALSNAYYGNTWRHQMVEAFEASAKEAKADPLSACSICPKPHRPAPILGVACKQPSDSVGRGAPAEVKVVVRDIANVVGFLLKPAKQEVIDVEEVIPKIRPGEWPSEGNFCRAVGIGYLPGRI